tara:strand:+ start:116 stop:1165 length:1050 start_codon:yes stop_codon:yes gene_type:complete
MKILKLKLRELVDLVNSKPNKGIIFFGKVYSLSYLTTAIEPILQNSKNKNALKDLIEVVNNSKIIFRSFVNASNFTKINSSSKNHEFLNFYKSHQKLWQKIWPEHSAIEYESLVEYRGKRLDFNKIRKEFFNKDVIDIGCGNGSISIAVLKRGAKSAFGIDFGEKNIQIAKKWAKFYKFQNKANFKKADILKFKSKKKYDFVICSAVLHHLKNKKEFNKELSNIASLCKKDAYFYFFVRGYGGARYLIQDACIKCFKNIDPVSIRNILESLNYSREKITHLVDWFKAIYLQTKPNDLLKTLKKLGFNNFKRLKGPHKNDLDINQIGTHKSSKLKFGTGELRFLCQYKSG